MTEIPVLGRRLFLASAVASIAAACAGERMAGQSRAYAMLADVEARIGGRMGIAVLDTQTGMRLSHRGGERFALCSTFKWMLAAMVLANIQRGEIPPETRIAYSTADILPFSPVTQANLAAGNMAIEDMCAAVIEISDNTSANLLLARIGGPPALTRFLRETGDPVTRLDRNEPDLNTNLAGDPRDTTTPDAMVDTMNRLLLGDTLNTRAREKLLGWMKNSRTGLERIRAGLPQGWIAGDKTGTGANGAANDVAIVWPPARRPILITIYMSGSQGTAESRNAAHADAACIIAAAHS